MGKPPVRYRLRAVFSALSTWVIVAVLASLVASMSAVYVGWMVERNTTADLARSCEDRSAGREDAKDAIAGGADEAAIALGASDGQRLVVNERVTERVERELPLLVCDDGPPPSSSTSLPPRTTTDFYLTCDEAWAAGVAPLREGDPGYALHLDRDGDGVACEG